MHSRYERGAPPQSASRRARAIIRVTARAGGDAPTALTRRRARRTCAITAVEVDLCPHGRGAGNADDRLRHRTGEVGGELREQEVALALPKMRLSYGTVSLKSTLRKLGLSTAFDGSSVFAGMSDDPTVHIGDVVTKAVLEIDEEGTVAAAAAAVKMTKRCAPSPPLELKFDRPFIVAILHAISGMPLFLALVHSPD